VHTDQTPGDPSPEAISPDGVAALQRRTVGTLVGSQMLGGIGLSAGIAVGSLLAEEVSGSASAAGLPSTFQVLGGALIAIPMAAVMARAGRRPGLLLGYVLASVGAVGIVVAGLVGSFSALLVASLLFGGGAAANSQARYAAADLAQPQHRGRDLSLVVWATTVGSVLGPNLVGPAAPVARALGLPELTGPYLFSLVGFVLGGVLLLLMLRPDPLLTARELRPVEAVPRGSVLYGLDVVRRRPAALLGLVTMAVGHVVMVSVMVMTPLHMHHGGAALELIGLVISVHVLGMFAFSPLTGLAVDRWGGRAVAVVGAAVQVLAGVLAATTAPGASGVLTLALFLLGLGWSATLVSGSALLVEAVTVAERAASQGAADLCMGLAGAAGGALAGVVVGGLGYDVLGLGAAVIALAIPVTAVLTARGREPEPEPERSRAD
jgi:MFS family permease